MMYRAKRTLEPQIMSDGWCPFRFNRVFIKLNKKEDKMKTKSGILLGMIILLVVSLMLPLSCAKETEIPATTEFKTYSKYGFSFEYPKKLSITEMGMLESEANENSGIVQAGVENDEVEIYQAAWLTMVESTWEVVGDLHGPIEDGFVGMEASEDIASLDRGELAETNKAGHQLLYQYYNATSTEGDKVYGIVATFYCDGSQKFYQLMTINNTISAKQDVFEDFQRYLDSFVCH